MKNGLSHTTVTEFKAAQEILLDQDKDPKRKLDWRQLRINQQHQWKEDGGFK